ncbi:MAG: SPASM domain-containing protein [Nanoarchaeota archaeon]|nr:SPASM domain-containing protein [Nanoarchaeota archaeon]
MRVPCEIMFPALEKAEEYARCNQVQLHISSTRWDARFTERKEVRRSAGITSLTMIPNGDICPCLAMPLPLGDVLFSEISEIWENHPYLKYFRLNRPMSKCCAEIDTYTTTYRMLMKEKTGLDCER